MKSLTANCLAAAAVIFVAGCMVGPNYHRPNFSMPVNWSEAQAGGVTNRTADLTQWWTTFNDPTLESLIARAVESNFDLRIATARLRQARAQRGSAKADLGPKVGAKGSYTRSLTSQNSALAGNIPLPPGYSLEGDQYQTGFDASWELDVFGGKRRQLESANADLAASMEDRRDTLVSLLAEVARNYFEVRGLQQRLAIARDNIKSQQASLDVTRARFNGGVASELDVSQAAAVLAGTQAQLPSLEALLDQGMHQLALLLGKEPGALVAELSVERQLPPPPPEVPVGLPSDLLLRRPDIRGSERRLASATAQIGVQTAELFPKFSLTGGAGLESVSASDLFTGGSRYWSFGPTVTWRIFESGRIRSKIRVQNAKQEEALATYEKTVAKAMTEVEDALVAWAKEQVRHRSLQDAVTANKRALELADELYTKGLTDFLNVLDAQRSLYQAEDELAQSNKTVAQNLIALYKALGGGWNPGETIRSAAAAPMNRGTSPKASG